MFSEVGKQRNIDRKHNVFATIAQGFRQSRYKILEQFYSQTLVGIQDAGGGGGGEQGSYTLLRTVRQSKMFCLENNYVALEKNHKLSDTKFNEILFD